VSACLAARFGDSVGHGSSFWANFGTLGGMSLGAVIGAAMIAAAAAALAVATAPLAIVAGAIILVSAVAGAVASTFKLGAAGEKLGEHYDEDKEEKEGGEDEAKEAGNESEHSSEHSSKSGERITQGTLSVFIETMEAAHVEHEVKHGDAKLKQGSGTVFFCKKNASRRADGSSCGGKVVTSAKHTYIGGPQVGEKAEGDGHEFGEWLEKGGDIAERVSLVTFLVGAVAGSIGVGVLASGSVLAKVGVGVLNKAITSGTAFAGMGLAMGGGYVGGKAGGLVDEIGGYKDGRWAAATSEVGAQTGGLIGDKIKEAFFMPMLKCFKAEHFMHNVREIPDDLQEIHRKLAPRSVIHEVREIPENLAKATEHAVSAFFGEGEVEPECKTCTEWMAPPDPTPAVEPQLAQPAPAPQLALPAPAHPLALPAPAPQLALPAPAPQRALPAPPPQLALPAPAPQLALPAPARP
jgi:hypothetical protein